MSDVSILSLYSESGISRIFFICSRNSFASFSLAVSFFSSFEDCFSSLGLASSDFFSFLSQSSGQKTLSSIESIQLFPFFGLASSISFHETSNVLDGVS
jgi:hypothetical protein